MAALGFGVTGGAARCSVASRSIWRLRGVGSPAGRSVGSTRRDRDRRVGDRDRDGAPRPAEHPNGAVGIDHVVAITPDFDRTAAGARAGGTAAAADPRLPQAGERAASPAGVSAASGPRSWSWSRRRDAARSGTVLGPGGDRLRPGRDRRAGSATGSVRSTSGPARTADRDARDRRRTEPESGVHGSRAADRSR